MFSVEWVINCGPFGDISSLIGVACIVVINWWCSLGTFNIKAFVSIVLNNSSLSYEDYDNQYNNLINGMSENVSPHKWAHYWGVFIVWLSLEDIISWWFSSESKGGECVHNKVNPKHLYSV
jgi:hypothetical protein